MEKNQNALLFAYSTWDIIPAIAGFFLNWKFVLAFLPFYYFGHCLSYLNGYFLHYGGNPDVPIAWGVSSYEKLYHFLWFNNGYHAEHHYRPRRHWTKMRELHLQIKEQQKAAGTHVIDPPHALGFLEPHQPPRNLTSLNTKEWKLNWNPQRIPQGNP